MKKDPLNYRGITLAPVIYKIYCTILNKRLSQLEEQNEILHDAQNGFRKNRSTVDHISSLTSIIETRKLKRKSPFAIFVDFKKAYDAIDRSKFFADFRQIGITGKMYNALLSLYEDVKCCVKVNGIYTDWFSVRCGLKQGCCLSPILFNLYINDMVNSITSLGIGVNIRDDIVSVLLYADDLVLLAESETDLQILIDLLHEWCIDKKMKINLDKTKIVHFRNTAPPKSNVGLVFGNETIEITNQWTYLGILLSEHLNYNLKAKQVAKSASRALGLVISKYKAFGGLPFSTFSKLFDSIVWSTINYGAAIWGDREFSCINAVLNRAERFFIGVGRYTPNAAVNGDMGWNKPIIKPWSSVINNWIRIKKMDEGRINKNVMDPYLELPNDWAVLNKGPSCKNATYRLSKQFTESGIEYIFNVEDSSFISKCYVKTEIQGMVENKIMEKWRQDLARDSARHGEGGNKLRSVRLFKREYKTENYLTCLLPGRHRSVYSKFRCGVAPLRLETGRYENLQIDERLCLFCSDQSIENETRSY